MYVSQNSSVPCSDWTMGWTADESGFVSRQKQEILLSSVMFRPALESTQPPIQCVPGIVSPGVKRQGREADH
jgi:hypothetical protein